MIKKRRFPRMYFGWWTVLATGILGLWASGYRVYGASAMFKPIASDLGLTRAQTAIPTSIGRFEGGLEGPMAGWLTDKFGPRQILLCGTFLLGLTMILMYYVNSFWTFCLVWGVLMGTASNLSTTVPVQTVLANWFVRKRGLAMGIQNVMNGASGIIVLPLVAWLLVTQGWRMTCVIGGVVTIVIGLPLTYFFIKPRRPEYYGLLPDGAAGDVQAVDVKLVVDKGVKYAAEVGELEYTLRQALRTPAFWLLVIAHGVFGLSNQAINIHTIPLLTDMGVEPLRAAAIMATCYVGASLPARVISGFLADRVNKNHLRYLLSGSYALGTIGFFIFLQNPTLVGIYIFLTLFGICKGASFVPFSATVGRYFGRKSFGSINGAAQMLMTPLSMAAPIYGGWVYDTTGSYITALTLCAVLLAFAVVIVAFALPPKPPAQITDIDKIV